MTNRLASESSPYLLQHKNNPVEWHPWGEEALEQARAEDRPILLSIGYSACHWCHVMERESFEDAETAELMNEAFVNVKVDREERPDLDSIYMTAVQSMTGQGGWPLTVFLTPEGVPYYGGTYFPPEPRQGMPSFRQVLRAAGDAYRTRPDDVREAGRKLTEVLRRATTSEAGAGGEGSEAAVDLESGGPSILRSAARTAESRFDERHGGFGGAPKFPQVPTLDFLLRHHADTGDVEALRIVDVTLDAMARGGIRDHLAGGFHRYTVDQRWLIPHFEKMLYDNALLGRLYLHHHLATGSARSRRVAVETFDYLLADFQSPEGGFYTARDADSEGEEGRYYVWTRDEVAEVLGTEDAAAFGRVYDVSESGNWEGRNILHLPRDPESLEADAEFLRKSREKLLARRSEREPPSRDEKLLVGWNGLALRGFAEAGAALERPDYLDAARQGAEFLLAEARHEDRLFHAWTDGRRGTQGFLEDYASLGLALVTLHEATLAPKWLDEARWCAEKVLELFWEDEDSLFYDTPSDGEELVIRPRDVMDNPSPSGTSLAVELLLRGAVIFGEPRYRDVAGRALRRETAALERHPSAVGTLLAGLGLYLTQPVEIALVAGADGGTPDRFQSEELPAARFLKVIHERYLPNRVVVGKDERTAEDMSDGDLPLLEGRKAIEGRTTAYVCRNYACRTPETDPEGFSRQLDEAAHAKSADDR